MADEQDNETPTPTPNDLGDGGVKALYAEREARKIAEARIKELEPLAAKAAELEEQSRTELDRLMERATAAESAATAALLQSQRMEVAVSKGLTTAQARRLNGSTIEELESDADELVESFGPRTADRPPGIPAVALQSGSVARDDQAPQDANAWLRAAVANATS